MRLPKFQWNRQFRLRVAGYVLMCYETKPTSKESKKHYNKMTRQARLNLKRHKNDYYRNVWEHQRTELVARERTTNE